MPKKKTESEYLEKFKKIHNDFYTYLKFPEVFNQKTKITIICKKHGSFEQTINNHSNGMGCPFCGKEKMSETKVLNNKKRNDYIEKIYENYGDEFNFSETNFLTPYDKKVKVICKTCGKEQYKLLSSLLNKKAGCTFCRIPKMQLGFYENLRSAGKENFLKRVSELFGDKFEYNMNEYKNFQTPITIICKEHGPFKKTPARHIYNFEGCPFCDAKYSYSRYETLVASYLDQVNIKYFSQYRITTDDYLKNKPYDFYLEDKNLLIEIDGPQHRRKCWNMTNDDLKRRIEIDEIKTEKAKELRFQYPKNINR